MSLMGPLPQIDTHNSADNTCHQGHSARFFFNDVQTWLGSFPKLLKPSLISRSANMSSDMEVQKSTQTSNRHLAKDSQTTHRDFTKVSQRMRRRLAEKLVLNY